MLDRIAAAGIARAVVNVHYLRRQARSAPAASARSREIVISDERDELLDTGGGVVQRAALLGAEPFLIHNSDSVWIEGVGSNLERLFAAWDADRMDSLMLLALGRDEPRLRRHGDFAMDTDGRLVAARRARRWRRSSSPASRSRIRGCSTARRKGAFSLNQLWDARSTSGRLYGVRLDGLWMHVGTPEALDRSGKVDRE